MKMLKNILYLIALITINAIDAKRTGAQAPARQQPPVQVQPGRGPALPADNFRSYLQFIRNQSSENVINEQGVFTDSFTKLVQSSNLGLDFQLALFEAGRNLHLPLSENSEAALETIMYAGERINGLMGELRIHKKGLPQPKPKDQPRRGKELPLLPKTPQNSFEYANELVRQNWGNILENMFEKTVQGYTLIDNYDYIGSLEHFIIQKFPQANLQERIAALSGALKSQIQKTIRTYKGTSIDQLVKDALSRPVEEEQIGVPEPEL